MGHTSSVPFIHVCNHLHSHLVLLPAQQVHFLSERPAVQHGTMLLAASAGMELQQHEDSAADLTRRAVAADLGVLEQALRWRVLRVTEVLESARPA